MKNYLRIYCKRKAYSRAIDRLLIQEQAEKAAALLPRYKMLQAAEKELLNEIKSKKMCEIHNEDAVQKELKPCPFCGQKPLISVSFSSEELSRAVHIECPCGASLTRSARRYSLNWLQDLVVKKWNNRYV